MKIWIIVVTLMCWVDKSNETLFYHFTTTYDVLIKVYKRKIRSLLYKYTFFIHSTKHPTIEPAAAMNVPSLLISSETVTYSSKAQ